MLVVILFRFGIKFATPAINLVAALLLSGTQNKKYQQLDKSIFILTKSDVDV